MVIDRWMNGEVEIIDGQTIEEVFNELDGLVSQLESMATAGKYWDAYTTLLSTVLFMNTASQQQTSMLPIIIHRLLKWI